MAWKAQINRTNSNMDTFLLQFLFRLTDVDVGGARTAYPSGPYNFTPVVRVIRVVNLSSVVDHCFSFLTYPLYYPAFF
jgi:hypothetical protein